MVLSLKTPIPHLLISLSLYLCFPHTLIRLLSMCRDCLPSAVITVQQQQSNRERSSISNMTVWGIGHKNLLSESLTAAYQKHKVTTIRVFMFCHLIPYRPHYQTVKLIFWHHSLFMLQVQSMIQDIN